MVRKMSLRLVPLFLALVLAALPGQAAAAEFRSGPEVRIAPDEVLDEDLYTSGGTMVVEGTVNGDLVSAGGTLNVQGTINGSVIAAGGSITVAGPVEGSIRAAGGRVVLNSSAGRDLIAAGGNITVEPGATVGGDLVAAGGNIQVRGAVQGDASLRGGAAEIAGTIGGNVNARTGDPLVLRQTARIEGDLRYTSPHQVVVEEGAVVLGETEQQMPTTTILGIRVEETPGILAVQAILDQVRWFLGTVLVGLLLLWLVPRAYRGAGETMVTSPLRSLGMGLLVLLLVPIVVIIVAVVAIFIAGIAAAPVAVVPVAAYIAFISLAAPAVALGIGVAILRPLARGAPRPWQALLLGAAILAVLGFVPFVSVLVVVLTLLFGFGAWLLLVWRRYTQARPAAT